MIPFGLYGQTFAFSQVIILPQISFYLLFCVCVCVCIHLLTVSILSTYCDNFTLEGNLCHVACQVEYSGEMEALTEDTSLFKAVSVL